VRGEVGGGGGGVGEQRCSGGWGEVGKGGACEGEKKQRENMSTEKTKKGGVEVTPMSESK